jgi:hypothetical protein
MRLNDIQEIVKDPEWQKLRKSFLGRWRANPTVCLGELKAYLGNVTDRHDHRFIHVYNYVTGTGFRVGIISHPSITDFVLFLRKCRDDQLASEKAMRAQVRKQRTEQSHQNKIAQQMAADILGITETTLTL